jgi:AGCS family alanine or glycine:cation symporter
LILWGAVVDLNTVFAFADITMTLLAFVNLIALAMLFKVAKRILADYDAQRKAGIKTPVFDSSKFPDLDLDRTAWPANPSGQPVNQAEVTAKPAPQAQ